jgi:adenosine kinase
MNGDKKRMVVFTQGAECTIVVDKEGKATSYPVPVVDDIVDANGAGDAFVGGFLAKLVEGKDIKECVNAGHYSAGVILRVSGTELKGKPEFK